MVVGSGHENSCNSHLKSYNIGSLVFSLYPTLLCCHGERGEWGGGGEGGIGEFGSSSCSGVSKIRSRSVSLGHRLVFSPT